MAATNYKGLWEKTKASYNNLKRKYREGDAEVKSRAMRMVWHLVGFAEVTFAIGLTSFVYGFVEDPDKLGPADGVLGFGLWGAGVALTWFDDEDNGMHVSDHVRNAGLGIWGHFITRQGYKLAAYVREKSDAVSSGAPQIDTGARRYQIPAAPQGNRAMTNAPRVIDAEMSLENAAANIPRG